MGYKGVPGVKRKGARGEVGWGIKGDQGLRGKELEGKPDRV